MSFSRLMLNAFNGIVRVRHVGFCADSKHNGRISLTLIGAKMSSAHTYVCMCFLVNVVAPTDPSHGATWGIIRGD